MRDAGERKRPFSKTNRSLIYDMQLWQISILRSLTGLSAEVAALAILQKSRHKISYKSHKIGQFCLSIQNDRIRQVDSEFGLTGPRARVGIGARTRYRRWEDSEKTALSSKVGSRMNVISTSSTVYTGNTATGNPLATGTFTP